MVISVGIRDSGKRSDGATGAGGRGVLVGILVTKGNMSDAGFTGGRGGSMVEAGARASGGWWGGFAGA